MTGQKFVYIAAIAMLAFVSCKKDKSIDYGVKWNIDSGMNYYVLSNGCTVRDSIGDGPMNERMIICDEDGMMLAVAGCASEWGCMMVVRFLYDVHNDKYEVKGLLRSMAETELNDEGYHTEVLRHVFEKSEDDEVFESFLFHKENGLIRKVYSPATNDSIKAPEWCHIEYAVRESGPFWVNDIVGGEVIPLFSVVPNKREGEYTIDVYNGYHLQVRKGYSKGRLHSITVFDRDGYVSGYFPMDTGKYDLDDVNGLLFNTWGGDYANIEN